jgi:hypothetical protein
MKEGEPKSKPEVLWSLTQQGPPQPNLLLYKETKKEYNTSKLKQNPSSIVHANWQSGKRGVVSMESIIIEQERGAFMVLFFWFVLLSFQVY